MEEIAANTAIAPAAIVTGDGANGRPYQGRHRHDYYADLERDAGAEHYPRKDVASGGIGAEPMRRRRRHVAHGKIRRAHVLGRDPRSEDRHQDKDSDDADTDDGETRHC